MTELSQQNFRIKLQQLLLAQLPLTPGDALNTSLAQV